MSVKHSGNWRTVQPGGLHVRHSGTWRQVQRAYVKESGSWRLFHQQSDPLSLNFFPEWTNTYGEGHLEEPQFTMDSETGEFGKGLFQGDWDGVGHPSGMGRVWGVMRFDEVAIAAAFGGRVQALSVSLRIHNINAYDGAATARVRWS